MQHPQWVLDDVAQAEKSWGVAHSIFPILIRSTIGQPRSGVEIGVAYGSMCISLVNSFENLCLVAVDPYAPYDSTDVMSRTQEAQNQVFNFANQRLKNAYPGRITLLRKKSMEAVAEFKDESFDFVFIDGCHQYESVSDDIKKWSEKVRIGGLISGHDYQTGWVGVTRAVEEYAAKNKKPIMFHRESSIWAIIKS